MLDPNARIDPTAEIADNVSIGPWTEIGPQVKIGEGSVISSHVIIRANTELGKNNRVFQFASIGEDPADKKYAGEQTWLKIGSDNIFREGVTVHRGTAVGGDITEIGNSNLMMPYVHVAHDCKVGDNTVFANNVGISGHVHVGDWAILGGYAGVNQFLKIGAHAMVGGMTHITNDVPAGVIVAGNPAVVRSINAIGLERRGFSKDAILAFRKAFKIVYKRGLNLQDALQEVRKLALEYSELQILIDSIEASEKGIHR